MVVVVLIVVVVGCIYILRRKEMARTPIIPASVLNLSPTVELKFTGVKMVGDERGVKHWTIEAPVVEVGQNERTVAFEGHPHGKFFDIKDWTDKPASASHNHVVTWKADTAEYDSDFKQMTIAGHDQFVTDDGDHMTTQTVIYHELQHIVNVTTPVKVKSHDGKLVMRADEATADTQLEVFEMQGHVQIDSKVGAGGLGG